MKFVTRFAPSPTGRLHLGHAFSALTAFDAARAAKGELRLRIEDIDRGRSRPEFEAAILDDLAWLGLAWREAPLRQSERGDIYAAALDPLRREGLIYRCFKTRREVLEDIAQAPHMAADGPDGPAYIGAALPEPEEAALLADGAPYAWRLSMAACRDRLGDAWAGLKWAETDASGVETIVSAEPERFGDAVIARKDAGVSYHLASVIDDASQGVTCVVRGEDLRPAAHLHRLLQALLNLPAPVYRHHRLILNEDGRRLAKRDKAATLGALREAGATPADIRARLGLPPAP
ncbi:MAG: tRNA glutamyl-Q(34) synthetase GluQRS [Pseudomonadota bacterium]